MLKSRHLFKEANSFQLKTELWSPFFLETVGNPFERFRFSSGEPLGAQPFCSTSIVGGVLGISLLPELKSWLDSSTPGWCIGAQTSAWFHDFGGTSIRQHYPAIDFAHEVDYVAFTMVASRFGLAQ